MQVRPIVAGGYVAGEPVEIRLQLSTTGRRACTLTLDSTNLLVRVTSGSDRIWTSAECPAALLASDLVIRRTVPTTYRVAWSGRRSAPRCPLRTEPALPGTYVAAASIIGGEPADSSFLLEEERRSERPARDRRPGADGNRTG